MKHIVCLGGGNAMPKTVLAGLKNKPVKLSVISATLDSGGSSGRLRKDYKIIAPGDMRKAMVALAETSPVIQDLFNYRFQFGELKGHNLANLLITGLELATGDYKKSFQTVSKFLNIQHEVLPVTLTNAHVCAELENGKIVIGEGNIDVPKHNGNLKIKRVFLRPKAKAYPRALDAIKKADAIIIGPGDLYSSLAQILLTDGVARAIRNSRAKKIYICNIMTKYGETNNFSVEDFTREIEHYLGGGLDYVIYHKSSIDPRRLAAYRRKHKELLRPVFLSTRMSPKKFLGVDVLPARGPVVHDAQKLSRVLMRLIKTR